MKDFLYSFYGKLSAVLLLLLLILGAAQLYITYESSIKLISAADQQINLTLADNIASELQPVLVSDKPDDEIEATLHNLMVYNPRIEIYVLDENGTIENFFADPDVVKAESVPLAPIKKFLKHPPQSLILGEDPRNPGTQKPFSAAEVNLENGRAGYLYVILSGQRYNSALEMVKDSYIIGTSLKIFAIILVLTGVAGLILFGLLTRRLRTMTDKVEAFEKGDHTIRLNDDSKDEVGQLAGSFNRMAATIQSNVKELQKTDELRRNLIANVSHDLRSPLASIQGYVETILIKEDKLSEEKRREYLQVIMNNTQMLRTLVNELFELSKLDAREVEPNKEIFSIAELIQDVVLKLRPRAKSQDVELTANVKDNISYVWADIGLIERVLTNLLQNAIDYTNPGDDVAVCLLPNKDHVTIEIRDSGQGIAKEDLPHIFDRFYRGDKSRSLKEGNTGLGLAIAQKILDLHDVDIKVESQTEEGTTFRFNLPLK